MNTSKRPWQGTFLAVINIIGAVVTSLIGLMFLFLQQALPGILKMAGAGTEIWQEEVKKRLIEEGSVTPDQLDPEKFNQLAEGAMGIVGGLGMVFGIIILVVAILLIFMARGALKGQKWSPIISIIFNGLGLLGALGAITHEGTAVPLVFNAFVMYCGIMCLRSDFFNKTATPAPTTTA